MDAKALYPNFHAEVHRYNVASAPTQRTQKPSRSDGSSNNSSRPRSTSGAPSREASRGGSRPSTSPSPQQHAFATSSRGRPESSQSGLTTTTRRRVLPPCVMPRANQYAAKIEDTKSVVTQTIARQRDFPEPTDDDDASSSSSDCSYANVDEDEDEEKAVECTSDNLQELVINARPRPRYARREHPNPSRRTLDRIFTAASSPASSPSLASVQSVPVFASPAPSTSHELTRNKSASALLGRSSDALAPVALHPLKSAAAKPMTAAAPTSWGDDEGSSFFLTEVDAKSAESQRRLARSIARGSFLLYGACDFAKAAGHLSHALELAQGIGDDGLHALLQHHLGIALKEDGKLQWAEAMQQKALLSAQRASETRLRGRALKALGVICADLRDLAKALDLQQEALALALAERDAELEARVYANLGNIASAHMQLGHALSCHKRDLRLSSLAHAESAVGQLRAHRNLALVYAKLGKRELQAQHERQAARWEDAYAQDMQTHPRGAIGNIYMQLATRDAALQELVAASILEIVDALPDSISRPDAGDSRTPCTSRSGGAPSTATSSSNTTADDPAPAVRPVLVKQVLITRASSSSSSLKRLG